MPTLEMRFPGRRYHATPPGHHVNEGLVEWPPSPWRLVRALLACGHATQRWSDVPAAGRRLVESLCEALPEYRLPPAALGHTRHYMPLAKFDKEREATTLVYDTFADVGDGALYVHWPVSLDDEATSLLRVLAEHLGYLGRSESWVLARVIRDDELPERGVCRPHRDGERLEHGVEQVALLAAEVPDAFARWRTEAMAPALAKLSPTGKAATKKQLKEREDIERLYPSDLLDALQWDTARWRSCNWSQAPGSRLALYRRRSDALEVHPPTTPASVYAPPVECALFALATPSGSRSALPPTARTLPQADLLHKALVAKLDGVDCPELSGRDTTSRAPLTGHRHAHVLPVDLDGDGHIDHVVVYARMGLGAVAQRALRAVKKTYTKGGVGELQVALAGMGDLADLRRLPDPLSLRATRLFGDTSAWISATPFVPPRHLKKHGAHSLTGQIAAELEGRGLPAASIEVLPWDATPQIRAMRHFVRRRGGRAPGPPADLGFAVRLRFERDVAGPIALGYGCHFGLGLFEADEPS